MTSLFAAMLSTIENFVADIFATVLRALRNLAWNVLCLLAAVTLNGNTDVAGRTRTRMTLDLTVVMLAVLVLLAIAVLATRVRQVHRFVVWLLEAATIALVLGQLVLGVRKLAIGAGPVVEGEEAFDAFLKFLLLRLIVTLVHYHTSFLFFLVLLDTLLQRLVKFRDPSLDTTKMERLTALLAIPKSTALVDGVVANDALLGALGE